MAVKLFSFENVFLRHIICVFEILQKLSHSFISQWILKIPKAMTS